MLSGKSAVVTGASRGIGKAVALKLAKEGANIAVIYAGSDDKAEETVREIQAMGRNSKKYKCDVSDFEQSRQTADEIIKDFGKIDILVNNAGITRDKLVLAMAEEDFDKVVDTNLKGAFNMIKHFYKHFAKNRGGKIINVSSVSGLMGNAGQANYSASKAGIIGLTKSVARELAQRNICCNAIAPGFIKTDMTEKIGDDNAFMSMIPMKRMGSPEEVASLAAFLADDVSNYITGEVIRIDGGLAM